MYFCSILLQITFIYSLRLIMLVKLLAVHDIDLRSRIARSIWIFSKDGQAIFSFIRPFVKFFRNGGQLQNSDLVKIWLSKFVFILNLNLINLKQ